MKKQNKRNKLARITLALLLILSMIGNTLILPAVAQENLAPTDETILPETPLDGTSDATGAATLPEPIQLTAADIPEFISAAALEERGAVERMRSEETNMSSVIFRNADGTRTMYMYGLPVKYTAMDGTVRDKSTNLVSVSTASVLLDDQPVAQTMAQMSTTQRAALQEELGILDAERAATTLHMLSTALTARGKSLSDMAYTTLDNDVYALFPTNLTQGMTLVFGEHSVRMTPAMGMTMTTGGNVTKTTTASLADSDVTERLLYPNVFGLGTAVQYTPTLTGVKEEILLSRNVGKNSFAFLLETGGLILTETNGQFTLVDPETEQKVGTLGEIIVFDSAGRIVRGTMTAQTILAGQKYGITISVDQEFLASATYPVSIDPTISIVEDIISRTIQDMGVYNHEDAWMSSFNEIPYIGKTSIDDYHGVLLYRFPFIYDDTLFPFDNEENNIEELEDHKNDVLTTAAQIGSAKLTITVAYSSQYPITLGMKQSSVTWSTNGMRICDADTYAAAMSGTNILSSTGAIYSTGTVELDVTEIMRAWFNYENGITHGTSLDPEKGFVLFSNNPSVKTQIGGVTGYTDSNKPFLTVDYITEEQVGPYYINNKESHQFLLCTDPFTMTLQAGRVADLGTDMEWMLYYMGGSNYALTPADYEGISFINSDGTLSIAGAAPEPYCRWTMITDWTDFAFRNVQVTDRVFSYIYNVEYSTYSIGYTTISTSVTDINNSAITDYSKWRMILKSEYVEFPLITLTEIALEPEQVDMYEYLNADNYSLTDPSSDLYIYGVGGTTCTVVNGVITPVTPGGSFTINVNHRPSAQFVSFTVYIMPLAEGMYFIKNKEVGKYMQVDNDDEPGHNTSGSIMELWGYDGGDYQKWNVIYIGNGYYTISSVKSGLALSVPSGSTDSSGVALVQESYSSASRMMWKITRLSSGSYILRPKSGEDYDSDWCMCAGNQFLGVTDGLNVEQRTYDDNDIYKDEWFFEFDTTSDSSRLPHPDAQNKTHWCWAACAKMVGEHNGGSGALNRTPAILTFTSGLHDFGVLFYGVTSEGDITADGGQREIVVKIHGDDGNHSGGSDEVEKAIEFASFDDMNIGTWGAHSLTASDIVSMNNELLSGRWLTGLVNASGSELGHFIVIQSYDSTTERYRFWDPWTNSFGQFTRTQLLNNSIHTIVNATDRTLCYVVYCK